MSCPNAPGSLLPGQGFQAYVPPWSPSPSANTCLIGASTGEDGNGKGLLYLPSLAPSPPMLYQEHPGKHQKCHLPTFQGQCLLSFTLKAGYKKPSGSPLENIWCLIGVGGAASNLHPLVWSADRNRQPGKPWLFNWCRQQLRHTTVWKAKLLALLYSTDIS